MHRHDIFFFTSDQWPYGCFKSLPNVSSTLAHKIILLGMVFLRILVTQDALIHQIVFIALHPQEND